MPGNVRHYSQKKLTELGVFSGPTAQTFGLLPDVFKFQYQNKGDLQSQESGMGQDGPMDITSEHKGASVTLEIKNQTSIETMYAYLQRQTTAQFVGLDPRLKFPAYFWSNEKAPDTLKRVRSMFVWGAMIGDQTKEVNGQPQARQFQFEALLGREFKNAIQVDTFNGSGTPVTALAPTKTTMIAWTDIGVTKYALVILRKDANGYIWPLDKNAGDYTETASTVTLTTGLATGEMAIMAYLYIEP